jgi:hypothetical protein
MWNHCGGSDMYVWQRYHCIRSITRYIYDHANIGSKMRLTSLPIHALVTRTQSSLSFLTVLVSSPQYPFPRIDYLFLQKCLIPVITARRRVLAKDTVTLGTSKPSEKTTSNVGYASHRQVWAEHKKKKSRDKAGHILYKS